MYELVHIRVKKIVEGPNSHPPTLLSAMARLSGGMRLNTWRKNRRPWLFAFYLPAWNQFQGKARGHSFGSDGTPKGWYRIGAIDMEILLRRLDYAALCFVGSIVSPATGNALTSRS